MNRSRLALSQRATAVLALVAAALLGGTGPGATARAESAQASPTAVAAAETPTVLVARINGPITTVTADYIDRAATAAEARDVDALLVVVDTPGGDLTSTQRVIQRLLNTSVPTLAWVGPPGAQAASAGTFVVLAAHAAGMAPRTTIGAASPVGGGGAELPQTSLRKATEDMAATARGLADRRGAEARAWADRAVRSAASASADEAIELHLVDVLADDEATFLDAVDGQSVRVGDEQRRLHTAGSETEEVTPTGAESLLARLIHPAVALLLLTIGANAILIELSHPGGFVAGILGVLALALGFYSLGVLEANLIGLVFMAAAFVLFVLDIKAPTHGALTAGGIVAFIVGAVILFAGGYYGIPWGTIIALAAFSALLFAFVVGMATRAMRRPVTTGAEALVGAAGVVRRDLAPEGAVLVHGELWTARAEAAVEAEDAAPLVAGTRVRVVGRDAFTLRVRRDPPLE